MISQPPLWSVLNSSQVKQDVGDATILVNNAGVVSGTKFLDLPDKVELTFKVNMYILGEYP